MRLVHQKGKTDCGVACLAMLTHTSYASAKRIIFGSKPAGLTRPEQMKRALTELGKAPAARLIPFRGRHYKSLEFPALIKTNLRKDRTWHWVVWSGNKLLDPKVPPYTARGLRPVSYLCVE